MLKCTKTRQKVEKKPKTTMTTRRPRRGKERGKGRAVGGDRSNDHDAMMLVYRKCTCHLPLPHWHCTSNFCFFMHAHINAQLICITYVSRRVCASVCVCGGGRERERGCRFVASFIQYCEWRGELPWGSLCLAISPSLSLSASPCEFPLPLCVRAIVVVGEVARGEGVWGD